MNSILKNVMKYSKNKVYHNGSYYSKIRLPFKKNEKLFIKLEYVDDQNSSQYRFLELMQSLQQ